MGRTCCTYGTNDKQILVAEPLGRRLLQKPMFKWEHNIKKKDVKEMECEHVN
jgi:hypothetical protein